MLSIQSALHFLTVDVPHVQTDEELLENKKKQEAQKAQELIENLPLNKVKRNINYNIRYGNLVFDYDENQYEKEHEYVTELLHNHGYEVEESFHGLDDYPLLEVTIKKDSIACDNQIISSAEAYKKVIEAQHRINAELKQNILSLLCSKPVSISITKTYVEKQFYYKDWREIPIDRKFEEEESSWDVIQREMAVLYPGIKMVYKCKGTIEATIARPVKE